MKVFLAGENGKDKIIPAVRGGREAILNYIGESDANFWRGGESRHWLHELTSPKKENLADYKPFILESFYYSDEESERLLPLYGDFLLDSGAFTFMMNAKSHVDWNDYIERYADYIVRNDIKKYFELDIDSVVGYPKVLEIRKRLETLTQRQCIPVWHSGRGTKEFERMCAEYPYVAIGGLVGIGKSEYARKYWNLFPWFINTAHRNGAKIHALGFTSLDGIRKYHFDSVDSTAWTTGNRFGFVYEFKDGTMLKHDAPKGKRLKDSRETAVINYIEWLKFQKWAYTHL